MTQLALMNIDMKKPSFFMVVNGKSNSGKSHLIKYIMREINICKPFDYGIVFSNTAWEGYFEKFVPKKYIHENFNEEIIKSILKIQKTNLQNNINKRCFIIFDDCCTENEFQSNILKKLAVMGRHYNITTILSTQYAHLVPPVLRSNCNYSVFFEIGSGVRELRSIYECYGQKFKNYDEFKQFYYKNVKDHKFVLWNQEKDDYLVYKCPEQIPDFKMIYNKKYK